MSRLVLIRDFWDYLKMRKKFRLLPIIIMLLLGLLIIFTEESMLSPFIYVLF